uniref:Uncharacterized protein n=1 Tax=Rhizophagus irregularis (strain DAOM 181602 / DAOM 197198 / MUCL 43194) TaxID=747089 RepID=U9U2Y3_RHIID
MKNLKPSKRSLTYHGNSDRTKRRKRKSIHEAIKANGQTLDKFFILNKSDDEREEGNGDDEREGNGDDEKEKGSDKSNNQLLDEYILKIENKLKTDKKITPGQKVRYKAVQYFFQLQKSGHRKLESARIITQLLNRGEWFSKCVQTWTKSYALYNNIPQIGRSKYPGKSLIDDEDIWLKISSYLRKVKHNVTIQSFCDYVSSEILPFLEIETKITIRYQNLMPTFEGNNLERRIDLTLDENKKLYILATHDETTFQSNDGLKSGWMPNEEQPLRKKG